ALGVRSSSTSRIIPPPMPVSIPSTSPPVMSKLRRAASSTPDTAKTKVPVRSRARKMISCRSASIPTPHITRPSIPDIPDGSDSAELEVVRVLVLFDIDDRRALAHEQIRDRAASVGAYGGHLSVGLRASVDGDEGDGRAVEDRDLWFLVELECDGDPR